MPLFSLKEKHYPEVIESLEDDAWIVACFCAQWCKSCRGYRPQLRQMAKRIPEVRFYWIDIEDHAALLDDLDVDKFPTLLIQRGNIVTFFSCVHPDIKLAERILKSQLKELPEELARQADSSEEHRMWQREWNLKTLLENVISGKD